MEQPREEMHEKIMKASDRKILRRQIELLAEYSRTCGTERIPEASQAMVCVHKELVKTKYLFFVRVQIEFFALIYFFKSFLVKRVKFIKG